jgi:hypothetical protein
MCVETAVRFTKLRAADGLFEFILPVLYAENFAMIKGEKVDSEMLVDELRSLDIQKPSYECYQLLIGVGPPSWTGLRVGPSCVVVGQSCHGFKVRSSPWEMTSFVLILVCRLRV